MRGEYANCEVFLDNTWLCFKINCASCALRWWWNVPLLDNLRRGLYIMQIERTRSFDSHMQVFWAILSLWHTICYSVAFGRWRFKGRGAYGGYLGIQRRRRASWPTKCSGELGLCEDPEIPEWGNPNVLVGFWLARGNLANWNILVARGRESKRDSPSSGERRGTSLNRLIRGCGRAVRVLLC